MSQACKTALFHAKVCVTLCRRKRMTAHECLVHPWLRGDYSPRLEPIDMMRYIPIRDKIRAKYKEWEKFLVPIGRLAEYSSLRKLQLEKYRIHDTQFGESMCQMEPLKCALLYSYNANCSFCCMSFYFDQIIQFMLVPYLCTCTLYYSNWRRVYGWD